MSDPSVSLSVSPVHVSDLRDADDLERRWHYYRRIPAQLGDVALCGHVKDRETTHGWTGQEPVCPLCQLQREGMR